MAVRALGCREQDTRGLEGLATTAYQEHRIAREVPGYRAKASRIRFDDPVYDAAMDLVTPAPGAPLSSGFTRRTRELLVDGPVPAAADLLVFAAEARPEHERELSELAEELVETADDGSTLGVDALSTLATSPLLGDLVDPVDILREADRCVSRWPGEEWIPGYVVFRLFPVLLERAEGRVAQALRSHLDGLVLCHGVAGTRAGHRDRRPGRRRGGHPWLGHRPWSRLYPSHGYTTRRHGRRPAGATRRDRPGGQEAGTMTHPVGFVHVKRLWLNFCEAATLSDYWASSSWGEVA
ncbi:hypothetical protein OG292_17430 [Streptomyces sp. NBC_01511]|uniref:hypothetical protein n=1 Tax=Streptomyces sp. NBC_01511 TaxID=2903889 RepID=UPI00386AC1D5